MALGHIGNADETFLNGVHIGASGTIGDWFVEWTGLRTGLAEHVILVLAAILPAVFLLFVLELYGQR